VYFTFLITTPFFDTCTVNGKQKYTALTEELKIMDSIAGYVHKECDLCWA
jgi:hypothetical protein